MATNYDRVLVDDLADHHRTHLENGRRRRIALDRNPIGRAAIAALEEHRKTGIVNEARVLYNLNRPNPEAPSRLSYQEALDQAASLAEDRRNARRKGWATAGNIIMTPVDITLAVGAAIPAGVLTVVRVGGWLAKWGGTVAEWSGEKVGTAWKNITFDGISKHVGGAWSNAREIGSARERAQYEYNRLYHPELELPDYDHRPGVAPQAEVMPLNLPELPASPLQSENHD